MASISRRTVPGGVKVDESITIQRSAADLFAFWRNIENLPSIMSHLQSASMIGDKVSHWISETLGGRLVEWDAEIIAELPNQMISWETLPGAEVAHAGSIWFRPAPGQRGTEVRVQLMYDPPGGALGKRLAKLFAQEPGQQIREDLRRFRALMEAGEIPTIQGQPRGPRKTAVEVDFPLKSEQDRPVPPAH